MNSEIGILSMAYHLPERKKSVKAVFQDEAISTERLAANVDFQNDIGIESIHLASDELPSSLCLKAAKKAISNARISPEEIDLIIDFTSIPEDFVAPTWAAAGKIQEELGAKNAWATAVNTGGCASYHVALRTACALM